MNDEILKLVKECRIHVTQQNLMSNPVQHRLFFECYEKELEAFYRAAFNAGLKAAEKSCDERAHMDNASRFAHSIRALEMKP